MDEAPPSRRMLPSSSRRSLGRSDSENRSESPNRNSFEDVRLNSRKSMMAIEQPKVTKFDPITG
jgi:hypothetical protein